MRAEILAEPSSDLLKNLEETSLRICAVEAEIKSQVEKTTSKANGVTKPDVICTDSGCNSKGDMNFGLVTTKH